MGSFVGLLVVDIAAESDQNHEVSEEIMSNYTREDEDEREPGRGNRPGNSRPEDSASAKKMVCTLMHPEHSMHPKSRMHRT